MCVASRHFSRRPVEPRDRPGRFARLELLIVNRRRQRGADDEALPQQRVVAIVVDDQHAALLFAAVEDFPERLPPLAGP